MGKLIGAEFKTYTVESFYNFVKSLIRNSPNGSKEVLGISISQKAGKTTIRLNRSDKSLNRDEVSKLAEEYKIEELELLKLLTKRKIGIFYGIDDTRAAQDQTALKANAGDKKTRKRKDASLNQLQQPECDSGMQAESLLQPHQEV